MSQPLPLDAAGTRPAFFEQAGLDQLLTMVLELAAETWVLRQRLDVLEAVAAQHGLPLREAAEAYKPPPEQEAQWAEARQQMFENMFRSLRTVHRPVHASDPDPDQSPREF